LLSMLLLLIVAERWCELGIIRPIARNLRLDGYLLAEAPGHGGAYSTRVANSVTVRHSDLGSEPCEVGYVLMVCGAPIKCRYRTLICGVQAVWRLGVSVLPQQGPSSAYMVGRNNSSFSHYRWIDL